MRNDPHRLLTVQACAQHFSKRLATIPVYRASKILKGLGYANQKFWWVYRDKTRYLWTADAVAETGLSSWPARSISTIRFIGGPPHKRKLYRGSLFTYLMDRILLSVLETGLVSLDGVVEVDEVYA